MSRCRCAGLTQRGGCRCGGPAGGLLGCARAAAAGSDLVDPDRFGIKLGWYRVTPGLLTIAGRRLDASAPPARASVPSGYGDTGFQASGVSFPTEGCWEITGTVDSTTLTFVMLVAKA